jgi:hypothetical protein
MGTDRTDRSTHLFAAAVFISAFLLFQVQPLISKAILPWFGGAPAVWTTCLLFFQSILFGGYAYAHLIVRWVPIRGQVLIHAAFIVVAAIFLSILPDPSWKPVAGDDPTFRILALLVATVGLPYFLLSATGPLLQRWFSVAWPGRSPYRLYAVSNAGSLIALLSYPFVFEPVLDMNSQAKCWSIGFWVYVCLSVVCGTRLFLNGQPVSDSNVQKAQSGRQRPRRFLMWFVLAMIASSTLLAITNTVCQDVAVIPFLWVVPLSLYLLSFILCFDSDWWYRRSSNALITCGLLAVLCWTIMFDVIDSLPVQVGLYFGILFFICMMCHGEISRRRPDAVHLTSYYLTLSAGGACGGLFVALAAPALFPDFWELQICFLAAAVCGLWVLYDDGRWCELGAAGALPAHAASIVLVVMVLTFFIESVEHYREAVSMTRNFYGVLKVEFDPMEKATILRHGRIIHGLQLDSFGGASRPTTYYSGRTGVGQAIRLLQTQKTSIRIGLVGLGAGTLAAWGRDGDVLRFYEINEDVIEQAETHFSFLSSTPAAVQIIPGDARLSLELEQPQDFDLLVLDAFSGDAVPAHLLTREAFTVYLKHLADDGIIAVHISNLYFDLRPVVEGVAAAHGLYSLAIQVPAVRAPVDPSSEWILMARDQSALDRPSVFHNVSAPQPRQVLWTDSFSNLFRILR